MRRGRGIRSMRRMLRELRRIFEANAVEGRAVFEYKTRLYFGRLGRE